MESDADVALAARLRDASPDTPTVQLLAETQPLDRARVILLLLDDAERNRHGDPQAALRAAQRAVEVDQAGESVPAQRAACLRMLGHAHRALRHQTQALAFYTDAAHMYRAARRPVEAARTQLGAIDALMYLGQSTEALALGRRLRRTFLRYDERLNAAKLDANLSNIHARLQRPRRALALADSAAAAFAALGEESLLAAINVNRGNILSEIGEFRRALDVYVAARAAFDTQQMRARTAQLDVNIGTLHAAQGHYYQALSTISAACQVFTELANDMDLAIANLELADVYLALNLDAEATALAAAAATIFDREGMVHDAAMARLLQARGLIAGGEETGAILSLLDRAIDNFRAEGYEVGIAIAQLYRAALLLDRDPTAALDALLPAERTLASHGLVAQHGESLLLKAAAHELLNQRAAAHATHRRARRLGQRYDLPWVLARTYHGEGRLHERRNPARARRGYEAAIEAIESMRAELQPDEMRISFVRGRLGPYEDLLRLLLRTDPDANRDEAFALVERARSRALLDLLAGNLDLSETGSEDPLRLEVEERIAQLREELHGHLSIIHDWRDDSRQRNSRYARREAVASARKVEDELHGLFRQWRVLGATETRPGTAPVVDVRSIQAHLTPGQALVEYAIVDDEVLAFVVGCETVSLVRRLCSASSVGALIDRLHAGLHRFSYGEQWVARYSSELQQTTDHHLSQLGDALLTPLAEELAPFDRLVIAPYGPLHYVPFHALRYGSASYLMDTHETVIAPSASVWVHCQQRAGTRLHAASALVLGVEDEQTPWMIREAHSVGRLFPSARVLTGPAARREALYHEGSACDVLHLACHGIFRTDDPLFSALRLADGWLMVYDIYNLRLRAQLVTLSGCQTGRQAVGPGDDLIGLARGFFSAGVTQLVVSLWMVNDESTSLFMDAFYKALKESGKAALALREAQTKLRLQFPHPYYWAPFVVIGAS